MKKLTALFLTVLMIFTCAVPAFAADDVVDIPIVNVIGKGYTIKNADGTNAFTPNTINRGEYIKQAAEPIIKEIPSALITGDYSGYVDALVDAVAPLYKDWALDENGSTETSGSYIDWDYKTAYISNKSSNYQVYDYVFNYDWRLSPLETADQLDYYIERVCEVTGAEKISLYGRCLGSNIVMAYLAKVSEGAYDHPNRVQNLIFNTPPIAGYIAVGALLSGSIKFNSNNIDQFVTYYLNNNDVFDDPLIELVAATTVSVLNYAEVLGIGTDLLEKFLSNVMDEALPRIALSSYGSFPSYWSMISDKYFDKAIKTIFNTDERRETYSVFIDKVNAYNELVSKKDENGLTGYEKILCALKDQGINIAVYAKYGYVTVPLFEGSNITGDTRGTATELSLGANATVVGTTFSKRYLYDANQNGTSKYISPDNTVDASTCLFPDTTWFEKVDHGVFPSEMDQLTLSFFRSNGTLTVDAAESMGFHRFMKLDKNNKLVAVEGEDTELNDLWSNSEISIFKKIIMIFIKFLESLFKRS